MKRSVVVLSLTLAALGSLLSPAMAEMGEPQVARTLSAADQAFLASLAKMPLAPAPAAKNPDEPPIGEMALCTATASCGGYNISCEGNNSTTSCSAWDRNCPGEQGHVTCDGNTTWCSETCDGCPPGWCDGEAECAWGCSPCDYTYTCNATYCFDRCRCHFSTCPL